MMWQTIRTINLDSWTKSRQLRQSLPWRVLLPHGSGRPRHRACPPLRPPACRQHRHQHRHQLCRNRNRCQQSLSRFSWRRSDRWRCQWMGWSGRRFNQRMGSWQLRCSMARGSERLRYWPRQTDSTWCYLHIDWFWRWFLEPSQGWCMLVLRPKPFQTCGCKVPEPFLFCCFEDCLSLLFFAAVSRYYNFIARHRTKTGYCNSGHQFGFCFFKSENHGKSICERWAFFSFTHFTRSWLCTDVKGILIPTRRKFRQDVRRPVIQRYRTKKDHPAKLNCLMETKTSHFVCPSLPQILSHE